MNCTGCAVVEVADAAVTVVATGVKVVAKTVETPVDVVTPIKPIIAPLLLPEYILSEISVLILCEDDIHCNH